ncbi:MAG: hypothetical protein ACK5AZ_18960 [Bryobacteraceae bacterium]
MQQIEIQTGLPVPAPMRRSRTFLPHARRKGSFHRFTTWVDGDLRTEGVVIDSPDRDALDLDGLDLKLLTVASKSGRRAAASHKLVLIGEERVAVHQLSPARPPALVWCGQATLTVASAIGRHRIEFEIVGGGGRSARVIQSRERGDTRQWWRIDDLPIADAEWRGRVVAFCSVFNNYAVVTGPLPPGLNSAQARRELFADNRLTDKLIVVEPQADNVPFVSVETAAGAHGAIPATAAATLALVARRSLFFADILAGGAVRHPSKCGEVRIALPDLREAGSGRLSVTMPSASVVLHPLVREF